MWRDASGSVVGVDQQRNVEVPPGWDFHYRLGTIKLTPFVFRRERGALFEIGWVNGEYGLRQSFQHFAGVRYLLRVTYDALVLPGVSNTDWFEGAIMLNARLHCTNSSVTALRSQPLQRGNAHEALWVIESGYGAPGGELEVFFSNAWPAWKGNILLNSVEVMVVDDDYGGDGATRYCE